jgi:hypothetical protein
LKKAMEAMMVLDIQMIIRRKEFDEYQMNAIRYPKEKEIISHARRQVLQDELTKFARRIHDNEAELLIKQAEFDLYVVKNDISEQETTLCELEDKRAILLAQDDDFKIKVSRLKEVEASITEQKHMTLASPCSASGLGRIKLDPEPHEQDRMFL